MPERNSDFGRFGASGVRGSELVGQKLDDLAGGIATPITEKRGLMARLNANGCTRVEIHPLNQSGVARPLQRDVPSGT